ncbi:MAG: T9SS type A sorting domain-containing protein, partial [Bacteroidota bacterium]
YDNDTNPANFDATNGSMSATSHPNTNGSGTEMDWREQFVFPVEWLSFDVIRVKSDARLEWITASEQNSDYFLVERSLDGQHFENLAKVNAAGTTSSQSEYQFTDQTIFSLSSPKILYRLKQVDLDGRFDYSKIVELQLGDNPQFSLQAYPNPVKDVLHIQMQYEGQAILKIVNNAGQVMLSRDLYDSEQSLELPVADWPAGIYHVILDHDQGRTFEQIVKN